MQGLYLIRLEYTNDAISKKILKNNFLYSN